MSYRAYCEYVGYITERRFREDTTEEIQFGFKPGRGTRDVLFAERQLMENIEQAYETVPRREFLEMR